jgi:MFS family permease
MTSQGAQLSSSAESSTRWPRALRSFRHRNFSLFFCGQSVAMVGMWMQMTAQPWLVYRLTDSSLLLGAMVFAEQMPIFLLAPFGGVLADRVNRRNLLLVAQVGGLLQALVLGTLTVTHMLHIWHLFVLAVWLGVVGAIDMPGRQAFVVDMVGKDDLVNAIALNSSLFNGAIMVGPALAGILVARIGEGACFLVNGFSKIPVILSLLLITKLATTRHPARGHSPLHNIVEGARWVRDMRPVRALFIILGLVSLLGTPQRVLMPVFAKDILHHGSTGYGILMGANGAGALIGAVMLTLRKQVKGLASWITWGSAGLGISSVLFAYSRIFWPSVVLQFPAGLFMTLQMTASLTLIQSMVPDRLRGRVMAFHLMMIVGTSPLGSLSSGVVARYTSAPMTVLLGGVGCTLAAGWFFWQMRGLHTEAHELILAQEIAPGGPPEEMTAGVNEL